MQCFFLERLVLVFRNELDFGRNASIDHNRRFYTITVSKFGRNASIDNNLRRL